MQRLSFLRNLHSSLIIISTRFVHSVNWQFLSGGGGGGVGSMLKENGAETQINLNLTRHFVVTREKVVKIWK